MQDHQLTAPFPYFGTKKRWSETIWEYLGDPDVYAEPCGGSIAALLDRPTAPRSEIICDTSGHVVNLWRATKNDTDAVALHGDYPTFQQDLSARHKWLIQWAKENAERLSEDPDFYDAKAAGWWAWGASSWIGSGWCIKDEDKRPHIADGLTGRGIQVQRNGFLGLIGEGERYKPWFQLLAERLSRVIVLNRDWKAAVTPSALRDYEKHNFTIAVFLDPPYRTEHRQKHPLYQSDVDGTSDKTAEDTWEWAQVHGERYRIGYACREGDILVPRGWATRTMGFQGISRADRRSNTDMIIFSTACMRVQQSLFNNDENPNHENGDQENADREKSSKQQ